MKNQQDMPVIYKVTLKTHEGFKAGQHHIGWATVNIANHLLLRRIDVFLNRDNQVSLGYPTQKEGENTIQLFNPHSKEMSDAIRLEVQHEVDKLRVGHD